MFNFLKSKGITQLRSVNTDYELINQVFQKLKDLNNSEIGSRKGVRDNKTHNILGEIKKQVKLLGSMDYILKVKTLRIGELARAQTENINKKIKDLNNQLDQDNKEFKRHLSNIKSKEEKNHIVYLSRHHEERKRRIQQEIAHLKKLIKEAEEIKKELRVDCKKTIEDSYKIIHNI